MDSDGNTDRSASEIREPTWVRVYGGRLPDLTRSGSANLEETFRSLGKLTQSTEKTVFTAAAAISFVVSQNDDLKPWTLRVGPTGYEVSADRADSPDLEVLVSEGTWSEIASGAVMPVEAFGQGRMRVRGDIALARKLLGALTRPDAIGITTDSGR